MTSRQDETRRAGNFGEEQRDGQDSTANNDGTTCDSTTPQLVRIANALEGIKGALTTEEGFTVADYLEGLADNMTDHTGAGLAEVLSDLVTAIYSTRN